MDISHSGDSDSDHPRIRDPITVGMCVGSAIFAIQKVTRLDPAMVFNQ